MDTTVVVAVAESILATPEDYFQCACGACKECHLVLAARRLGMRRSQSPHAWAQQELEG